MRVAKSNGDVRILIWVTAAGSAGRIIGRGGLASAGLQVGITRLGYLIY